MQLTFKGTNVGRSDKIHSYAADNAAAPRFVASYRRIPPANSPLGDIKVRLQNGKTLTQLEASISSFPAIRKFGNVFADIGLPSRPV